MQSVKHAVICTHQYTTPIQILACSCCSNLESERAGEKAEMNKTGMIKCLFSEIKVPKVALQLHSVKY